MRREERVTVQGPVKEQQSDGMSHGGGYPPPPGSPPPPPDQSDHRGKERNLQLGNLIGPFLVHTLLPPPPPLPRSSLLMHRWRPLSVDEEQGPRSALTGKGGAEGCCLEVPPLHPQRIPLQFDMTWGCARTGPPHKCRMFH